MTKRITTEKFVERAIKVHGNKYDYTRTIYNTSRTKVKIKCKKHNTWFLQIANNHLRGYGCPECGIESQIENQSKTSDQFIHEARQTHKDVYDYPNTKYINAYTKVSISCKTHGEFLQLPTDHVRNKSGCPKCRISHGEREICDVLDCINIDYVMEYTFSDCVYKLPLPFDFYIPSLNLCIEYDGEQHFKPLRYYKDVDKNIEKLKLIQHRDSIKTQYCKNNNIGLIRISYIDFTNIETILYSEIYRSAGTTAT